jgi:hypothetical protein
MCNQARPAPSSQIINGYDCAGCRIAVPDPHRRAAFLCVRINPASTRILDPEPH